MQPTILESSSNSIIVALSETEIGKVVLPNRLQWVDVKTGERLDLANDGPTAEKEAEALQFANRINDLMPKFIRAQKWEMEDGAEHGMLVMERLFPLPIHHFDLPVRTEMMERFEEKMRELHKNGFVHGDCMRPTTVFNRGDEEWMFRNIVQTESGLRLIDAGFGNIRGRVDIRMFVGIQIREEREIGYFREYYLG